MRKNESGDISSVVAGFGGLLLVVIILALIFAAFFVRFKTSQEVVSGIVYNTTNNSLIGGKTYFSVRASVDTYTNETNASSYCLPKDSPYITLVNKAAKDKNVKVIVTADPYFAIQPPFTCRDNVTVTQE